MRRRLFLMILFLCCWGGAEALASRTLQVSVKSGPLRATPNPFGKILKNLDYGARVEDLEVNGAWRRVRYDRTDGWMHDTLLTSKAATLGAGGENVASAASSEDLTLAGKGFNDQVEAAYRREHAALDYATIDRMEKQVVTQKQMSSFLAEGGFVPEGGGDDR